MITKKQIREIESFNLATLNEALKLAEQRLNDALKTKEDLDKKSFSLLTIFLSLSATFFSLPQIFKTFESALYWSLIIAGFLFLIGVIALLFCLWPKNMEQLADIQTPFFKKAL
jgi:peptidoglycan/LPS O-acetylase OafA/YrhL